ncbi:acetate/propionate family kinase [Reinekea sp.]|jgi:acetate kinase|uniref:acetate/propionate family kinase n=1 Tax=Reinekea sp. TaxID=1970455 RepID=UPI0039898352
MSQNILVLNSGSSSIKFSLFDMLKGIERASGLAERLGGNDAELTIKSDANKLTINLEKSDYKSTLLVIIEQLKALGLLTTLPIAVGHRVVHGGEAFSNSVIVDQHVINSIKACTPLAPLHNPANVAGIEALQALYPEIPQVVVFDTAFHQTLKPEAFLYGVPYELYTNNGVRRYGFHGTSHHYVAEEAVKRLQLPSNHGIITAHLGNGCSACAVKDGKSVDTTMGMTPLEGLVMGTRSGDVDPGLHEFLSVQKGWDIAKITSVLNKESGLLGLSGVSNDMRTLLDAADQGNEQAKLAVDVFCFRLARQIGGLAVSLSTFDALVFTGGIGENSRPIRQQVIDNLSLFGFKLDAQLNQKNGDEIGCISMDQSPKVLVINTQEEWMIAKKSHALVTAH